MTDTTSSNIQLVQDTYAAFDRGDIDAVIVAMHPDIDWHEAEHSPWHAPGGHHGPTEVLTNVFARIPHDFDRFEVHPTAFHDAGETVIVEGRYRASAAGDRRPARRPGLPRVDRPRRQARRVPAIHRHLAVRPGHQRIVLMMSLGHHRADRHNGAWT